MLLHFDKNLVLLTVIANMQRGGAAQKGKEEYTIFRFWDSPCAARAAASGSRTKTTHDAH